MRSQLKQLGFSYDWDRELATCTPEYYRWEQWLFLKMVERGMAYRKESFVNWCDPCQTVLANEQVEGGKCERCGTEVGQRLLSQWFFRITKYADELLSYVKELRAEVLAWLADQGRPALASEVTIATGCSSATLRTMVDRGLVMSVAGKEVAVRQYAKLKALLYEQGLEPDGGQPA